MRVCCYYPWFPEHWQSVQPDPPLIPGYATADPTVMERQMRDIKHAKIDALLCSWWGPGSPEDGRFRLVLDAANRHGLKVAALHEPLNRANPSRARMASDLTYLRQTYSSHPAYLKVSGKPAVWVFTHNDPATVNYQAVWADWMAANANRATWLSMRTCYLPDGRGWKDLSPPAFDCWWDYEIGNYVHGGALPHSLMISPGMHTWDRPTPELPRGRAAWEYVCAQAALANPPFVVVVSWNEHEEGTGVEPSEAWGTYHIDALHRT